MKRLLYNSRVSEVDDVADKIERICKANPLYKTDTHLSKMVDEISALSQKLTSANKRDKAVSTLDEADSVRDEAQTALGGMISGYLYFPDSEKVEAAQAIRAIVKKYAGITTESYARQSALTKSEIEELKSAAIAEKTALLPGVPELIERLEKAQEDFDRANDEYNKSRVGDKETPSATSLKKPLLSAINDDLLGYLSTMKKIDSETYSPLCALIESEIERMNEAVSERDKMSAKK